MMLALAASAALLLLLILWRTVVVVAGDGYGHRNPPRSHHSPFCDGVDCRC